MASTNIKLFDENKGNMATDQEYSTDGQRLNGVQSGVASSKLQNKTLYQLSLVAYAIAQIMVANGKDAKDTDDVSTFINNLSSIFIQPNSFASDADVLDPTITDKMVSPETLAVWFATKFATQAQVNAGQATDKVVSPSTLYNAITNRMATNAEADAGTSTLKLINPATLKRVGDTKQLKAKTVSVILSASGWVASNMRQGVTVQGVTTSNTVFVAPAPTSFDAYSEAGIRCIQQVANNLIFQCNETPNSNVTVNIVIFD